MSTSSHDDNTVYSGHHVIDERGDKVGTVIDVIYDDPISLDPNETPTPTWLVVDPGVLRPAHYVPVAGSYRSENGDIVVPWDRSWIKSAPKAAGAHIVTDDLRRDLVTHYQPVG